MSSPSSSNYLSTQNSDISSTFSLRSNLSRSVGSLEGDIVRHTFDNMSWSSGIGGGGGRGIDGRGGRGGRGFGGRGGRGIGGRGGRGDGGRGGRGRERGGRRTGRNNTNFGRPGRGVGANSGAVRWLLANGLATRGTPQRRGAEWSNRGFNSRGGSSGGQSRGRRSFGNSRGVARGGNSRGSGPRGHQPHTNNHPMGGHSVNVYPTYNVYTYN
uniref:Uncharacterized protein n=1 Tax=Meloidogyne enterolobii TaxID=390850 RepID=A0A6V7YCW2_MELEN|nr:unnamed protein product [Meloidogyne enterolobii]CAD2209402.1 unnamed protein product [Meloidogyne enterolobii]